MRLPWGLVSYLYSATEGCDKLGQFATFLVQGNTALPGICEHLVGVPGDYHGLMVGVHKVVGVPERGIVQILQYPSGGAILLPDDHHAVLSDCVLVRIFSNIPNISLARCFLTSSCSGLRPLLVCTVYIAWGTALGLMENTCLEGPSGLGPAKCGQRCLS